MLLQGGRGTWFHVELSGGGSRWFGATVPLASVRVGVWVLPVARGSGLGGCDFVVVSQWSCYFCLVAGPSSSC